MREPQKIKKIPFFRHHHQQKTQQEEVRKIIINLVDWGGFEKKSEIMANPVVFFDITIDGAPAGRIEVIFILDRCLKFNDAFICELIK